MQRILAVTLALGLAAAAPAPAAAQDLPPDFPATPAATVFRAWLAAVNGGDTATVRAYAIRYEAERPNDPASVTEVIDNILNVARQSGGIRFVAVRASRDDRIELQVQDARGTALAMFLEVGQVGGAWRVMDIGLRRAGAEDNGGPPDPPPLPAGLGDAALAESLAARVDARAAAGEFDGALLIARLDGPPLLRRAWGTADRRTGTPNTPETRFALASMGKMFTATALAQLVEAGRVALDSPLARYLPDYPNRDFARRATVRHLLAHTSGLGTYWGPDFDRRRASLLTPADHLPLFVNEPLPFAPGAQFRYSNAGFQVLGLIIERVSGMSYYDYVQRHVFDRAGMTRTGYYAANGDAPSGTATGYTRAGQGPLAANDDQREVRGGPAGGGFSTADDLLRFFRALTNGTLMRRETFAEFTRGQSEGGRYGLGFGRSGEGRARWFGHNGGAPGMATWGLVYPELGLVAITLTNRDPAVLGPIQQPLMAALAARGAVP